MSERVARRLSVGMRVAFGCVIASSWRCTLLVDTAGLSGAPAPPADGASESSDGPVGATPLGADAEAGADAEVGFRNCDATPHELCDDFDNGLLGVRWSGELLTGAILALSDAGLSPPFALHATLPPPPDGGYGQAGLYKDIGRSASLISCELDVQVLDGNFQAFDVSFSNTGSTNTYGVSINLSKTSVGAHLREYTYTGGGNNYSVLQEHPLPAMPVSVWHHASLLVSIAGPGAGAVKLALDGIPVVDASLTPSSPIQLARLTLSESYTSMEFEALFDNVFCDIR